MGLLGLSPNRLVSAAADATLRVWNPETGEMQHALAAHTGAITCFQHDEFKILSGSDGNLKMWDIRDGCVSRDLLTGVNGVWQVVFEGRWCVAASNRPDATYLDVWDFGNEEEEEEGWLGEADGSLYDEDFDGEFERRQLMWDEDEEDEEAVAMDLELEGHRGTHDDRETVMDESPSNCPPASSESPNNWESVSHEHNSQRAWATPARAPDDVNHPPATSSGPGIVGPMQRELTLEDGTPTRPRSYQFAGAKHL